MSRSKQQKSKLSRIHGGEIYAINDKRTSGHGSILCKPTKKDRKTDKLKHIPITHSSKTRKMSNIPLVENPQSGRNEQSYVLPKIQKSNGNKLGANKRNMKIKNTTDKAVVRHIKKQSKKKK